MSQVPVLNLERINAMSNRKNFSWAGLILALASVCSTGASSNEVRLKRHFELVR